MKIKLLFFILLYELHVSCKIHVFNNIKLLDSLLHRIDQEQSVILFAMFNFTHPDIARALVRKQQEGVIVQGVVDALSTKKRGWQGNFLNKHEMDIKLYQSNTVSCMHHKFVVFGEDEVWTGSANWTKAALEGVNYENIIVVQGDPVVAEKFKKVFYQMYRDFT